MINKKSLFRLFCLVVSISFLIGGPVFSKDQDTSDYKQAAINFVDLKTASKSGVNNRTNNNIINASVISPRDSFWLNNGNNIYNVNIGNVGIGTMSPHAKLSVVGKIALDDGAANVAVGENALSLIVPGSGIGGYNTAMGFAALSELVNGNQNAAFGHFALGRSLGNLNSAFGDNSLVNIVSGGSNSAFGQESGSRLVSGDLNTFLGAATGSDNRQKTDVVNSTAIGYGAYTTNDNQVVIGGESVNETIINGDVAIKKGLFIQNNLLLANSGADKFIGIGEGLFGSNLFVLAGYPASEVGSGNGGNLNLLAGSASKTGNGGNVIIDSGFGGSYGGNNGHVIIAPRGASVGIGTTNPQQALSVVGQVWASGGYLTGADRRWQKDVASLSGALNKILKLKPIIFYWRTAEFPNMKFSNNRQLGLAAQEVESIFPEAVLTNENGYKSIDYDKLIPVLIQAIKEQQQRIDYLEAAIKAPANFK